MEVGKAHVLTKIGVDVQRHANKGKVEIRKGNSRTGGKLKWARKLHH